MGTALLSKNEIFRLPYGMTGFARMRRQNKIYVDKTELLYGIAGGDATYFLSRPKRFGKSLLVSTLESLFSRGLEDFRGLAIEKLWQEGSTYKVVHLDFSLYADMSVEELKLYLCRDLANLLSEYKTVSVVNEFGQPLLPGVLLNEICTGGTVADASLVLLVDEYDAPITHHLDDPVARDSILKVISGFFAAVKKCQPCFRFIFITGMTRISHVSLFSVFNNLKELTLDSEYNTLVGFTEEELHCYFNPYVENAASVLDMTVDDVYSRLKTRYDGYRFTLGAGGQTLYNPWSVLSFLDSPHLGFANYWYQSGGGTPQLLIDHLKHSAVKLDYSAMKHDPPTVSKENINSKSEAAKIPIDLLLWQTGYYTLQHRTSVRAALVFPNEEVEDSMTRLIEDINQLGLEEKTESLLDDLPSLIDAQDLETLEDLFNRVFRECLSSDSRVFNYEPDIRNIIYMKIPEQGLTKLRENTNSEGESDLELKTRKTHLVIEFKRTYAGRSIESALADGINQIKTRDYGKDTSKLLLVRVVMVCSTQEHQIVLTKRVD